MKPRYTIEQWPHGWLVCGVDGRGAVPLQALSESAGLFPADAVMDLGIPHHFHASGRSEVVCCVAMAPEAVKWRAEIEASVAGLPPEERWWNGIDVGASSAAVFAVFCKEKFRFAAQEMSRGAVPRDADDFERCSRLLGLFPKWRAELERVANAYPDGAWPKIVSKWDELEQASATRQSEILSRY
jgi:hypothetical protein